MNANPFTLGHAYLLERAASENDRVVLFVLSEDRSLVPFCDRLAMVKAAAARYANVSVVESGSYMISSATFPSYFLKDGDLVTRTHAALDATLFTRIAKALTLTRRYVGEEPFSHTTCLYNEALASVLPQNGVELVVVPRKEAQGAAISASMCASSSSRAIWRRFARSCRRPPMAYLTGRSARRPSPHSGGRRCSAPLSSTPGNAPAHGKAVFTPKPTDPIQQKREQHAFGRSMAGL